MLSQFEYSLCHGIPAIITLDRSRLHISYTTASTTYVIYKYVTPIDIQKLCTKKKGPLGRFANHQCFKIKNKTTQICKNGVLGINKK